MKPIAKNQEFVVDGITYTIYDNHRTPGYYQCVTKYCPWNTGFNGSLEILSYTTLVTGTMARVNGTHHC